MRPSYDRYFITIAGVVATRSTCARRAVGAVLVDARQRILATGYNGVGRGQPHCTETPCPGVQFDAGQGLGVCEAIHAEQNALLQCRDPDRIYALYCTTAPCKHCTKMLLNTGCDYIFFLEDYPESGERLWRDANKAWVKLEHIQLEIAINTGGLSTFVGGGCNISGPRDERSEPDGKGAR